jgi:hypothetical protein
VLNHALSSRLPDHLHSLVNVAPEVVRALEENDPTSFAIFLAVLTFMLHHTNNIL